MNYLLPDRLDALARAYALGTLSPRAARRFALVIGRSGEAARAVARWREILGTLELGAPGAFDPGTAVWDNVQGRLFHGAPATPTSLAPARGRRGGWLAALRPGAIGLAAGVLLLAGALQWRPQSLGVEPLSANAPAAYVGVLLDDAGHAAVSTIARRHGRVLTVRLLQPVPLASGQVLTLWAWNDKDPTRRRVASWSTPATSDLALPAEAEALLGPMTHLGVSKESAGATPVAPTTPLLAQGPCAKVW